MDATEPRGRLTLVGVLCTAALLVSACGGTDTSSGDAAAFDGTWILAEGTGPDGDIELDAGAGEPARVTLIIEERDWGGTAACNSYGGTVTVDDGTVTTDTGFQVTEMACEPPELMATESAYLAALTAVDTAALTTAVDAADALTLTGPDTLLRFTRQPEGDTP